MPSALLPESALPEFYHPDSEAAFCPPLDFLKLFYVFIRYDTEEIKKVG
jgi:hypothetical protein